eukprot:2425597-Amphidinium_carterae.1
MELEDEKVRREKERNDAQKAEAFLDSHGFVEARQIRKRCLGCVSRRTILHEAVCEGDADLVRTLIAMQADPDITQRPGGQTPLDLARALEEKGSPSEGSWDDVIRVLS